MTLGWSHSSSPCLGQCSSSHCRGADGSSICWTPPAVLSSLVLGLRPDAACSGGQGHSADGTGELGQGQAGQGELLSLGSEWARQPVGINTPRASSCRTWELHYPGGGTKPRTLPSCPWFGMEPELVGCPPGEKRSPSACRYVLSLASRQDGQHGGEEQDMECRSATTGHMPCQAWAFLPVSTVSSY